MAELGINPEHTSNTTVPGLCFKGHGNLVVGNSSVADANAEIDRQDRITQDMSGIFDFDAFVHDFEDDDPAGGLAFEPDFGAGGTIDPADLTMGFPTMELAGAGHDGDVDI